jgi:hypothetical protein
MRAGRLLVIACLVIGVLAAAAFAFAAMRPRDNPSGQSSHDPNERCSPSPCGAPNGFEVDVTQTSVVKGRLAIAVVFRNHTTYQPLEAVSYRHTSPADFTLRTAGNDYRPVYGSDCPSWPELDVPRGKTSPPRVLCFAVASASGATLVWDPDLGVLPRPVSISLG